ncbi:MAG: FCD domain-containing protein [Acetobacteraceae bacterium]|jgi:DNA-binding FadR family transcriptional regulator|nr:FCD domain-containing protein [Acetobacteraceae bacterium]
MPDGQTNHANGPEHGEEATILTLLQAYLATAPLPPDGRLPPERELATTLGISRGALRKALAVLEAEGQLWRHVGKGTFLGARPIGAIGDVAAVAARLGPAAVMQARLVLEPALARLAALNATAAQLAAMAAQAAAAERATSWRHYESQDAALHRTIAEAAGNPLLLHLFDQAAAVRRAVTWARPRGPGDAPPRDHHSFADHQAIVAAITARDGPAAEAAMRAHIGTVLRGLGA